MIFEPRYRILLRTLLQRSGPQRVWGLVSGDIGTLVTLGAHRLGADGCEF
jgi:Lon protease-like protein